ncbi:MAG TPA: DUF1761 family protein [Planctomycetota bacterium]|nr:DUF1761 family protein [Planctomycetota bacterium]
MNWKSFAIAVAGVSVLNAVTSFLIHAVLLHGDYAQHPALLRTQEESQAYFPFMLLNFLAFSVAFVWIYAFGVQAKPWLGQGLRFGLLVWLMTSVTTYLTYYAVQPWPGALVAKQIGYELARTLALGVAASALYRK